MIIAGKTFRTIISIVLVIAIIGTGCVFANNGDAKLEDSSFCKILARFGINEEIAPVATAEIPFPGNKTMVVAELSNGDALMLMYSADEELIYTSLFDRSEALLRTITEGKNGVISTPVKSHRTIQESIVPNKMGRAILTGGDTGARVRLAAYDDDGIFIMNRDIEIEGFETTEHKSSTDISGYYYSEADLASSLCMDLFNSMIPMAMFAAAIVAGYGVIMYNTAFMLTNVSVYGDKNTLLWQSRDIATNATGSISGSRFVCYSTNCPTFIRETGYYYPSGSLVSHNNSLAINCFKSIYSGVNASVVSWISAW